MQPVSISCEVIEVHLAKGPDMCDITARIQDAVRSAALGDGCVCATMNGSTGSLTAVEYEPGAIADLKRAIRRLAPPEDDYAHELAWHDGNGHSHVQAALMGPSLTLPVRSGRLVLGTWQQVVAVNHDNRPRTRRIDLTLIGTCAAKDRPPAGAGG